MSNAGVIMRHFQTSGLSEGTPRTTLAALVLRCARSLSDRAYRKLFCQALIHHREGEGKAARQFLAQAIPRPDPILTTSTRSAIYNLPVFCHWLVINPSISVVEYLTEVCRGVACSVGVIL